MMNFALTEKQKEIQEKARRFAQREVAPGAQERDITEQFPMELVKKLGEEGLIGLQFSKEYGGHDIDYLSFILVVEELCKADSAFGIAYAISSTFTTGIDLFANKEQKMHCMPRLFAGDAIGCFALTEPNAGSDAGSDAASARTTAIFDEKTNEYVLNGTKCFISGGSQAGVLIVFALTDPSKGINGMSAIIVEKDTPGFQIRKVENKMGLGGSETAELIFENCRVPAENLLGREGQGFKIAMQALDGARVGVGAQAVGVAEGAIDLSVHYAKERIQFGRPIGTLQGIQWYIADMATKTEAAKALVYYAAYLADDGKPFTKEAAMCKLNASEIDITENCHKRNLSVVSPIIVTYYNNALDQYLMKDCDVEFGVLVEGENIQNEESIRLFGGFEAVTKIHVGSYRNIMESHVRMIQWINQNDYEISGPISE